MDAAAIVRLIVNASSGHGSSTAAASSSTSSSLGPSSWCDDWKVLIYDATTKQLISPLLTLSELRSCGITLTLPAEAPRDRLPDIPAMYLIGDSPLSTRLLLNDASDGRYREVYAAFVNPLSRPALEAFAAGAVAVGAVPRITKVLDVYSSFIALQPRLFTSLGMNQSFTAFASPSATEDDVTQYARNVVTSVISVCATCGIVPVLVASRGGPAEMVARLADQALRDHLASPTASLFTGAAAAAASSTLSDSVVSHVLQGKHITPLTSSVGARPVFILLDRAIDLAAPLAHASSYEALVDDCVGPIVSNRVGISETSDAAPKEEASSGGWLLDWATGKSSSSSASQQIITLDPDGDSFWASHCSGLFPDAIVAHEQETASVQQQEAATRLKAGQSVMGESAALLDDEGSGSNVTNTNATGDFIEAIDTLPILLKRKKALKLHDTLLHAVMTRVAARVIPHFHDAEAPALFGSYSGVCADRAAVLAKAGGGEGMFEDRLRLAAIYLLTCLPQAGGQASAAFVQEELDALLAALRSSLPASAAPPIVPGPSEKESLAVQTLYYIKHLRTSPSVLGAAAPYLCTTSVAGGRGEAAGGLFATLQQTTSVFLNRAVTRLTQGDQRLPVTRIVASVCEGKSGGSASAFGLDNFLVLDPRQTSPSNEKTFAAHCTTSSAAPGAAIHSTNSFKNAIVFMVGGATYIEQADLQAWASSGPSQRTLVFGGTEMLSPAAFLNELAVLGKGFAPSTAK